MTIFQRRGTRVVVSSGKHQPRYGASPVGYMSGTLAVATGLYLLFQISSLNSSSSSSSLTLASLSIISSKINDASLKASFIIPNSCPVNMSASNFDLTYNTGFWDIPVQKPEDFYLNGGLPKTHRKHSRKSSSGSGSALGIRTETSLTFLREVISNYSIRTMIDIACGDANWIFDSWETDTIPFYLGLDVAAPVIALNQARFRHHSNKIFRHWNGYECESLPRHHLVASSSLSSLEGAIFNTDAVGSRPFDLIHARDVIQHVQKENGVKMLCNIFESGAGVFVTTSYLNETENRELGRGEGRFFQPYNFDLSPFDFGAAESCIMTHPDKHELDSTCVYDLTKPWVQQFIKTKCSSS